MSAYIYIPAKHSGPPRPGARIDLVVVHVMEAVEKPGTARAVGHWFAGPEAPEASTTYGVDADEIVQYVPEDVVAWACGERESNRHGISVELAGYSAQTSEQWNDDYSQRLLARAALLVADICIRHELPIQKLEPALVNDLTARGICGHLDITLGRNEGRGHTDPGVNFPWERFLDLVFDEFERRLDTTQPG